METVDLSSSETPDKRRPAQLRPDSVNPSDLDRVLNGFEQIRESERHTVHGADRRRGCVWEDHAQATSADVEPNSFENEAAVVLEIDQNMTVPARVLSSFGHNLPMETNSCVTDKYSRGWRSSSSH